MGCESPAYTTVLNVSKSFEICQNSKFQTAISRWRITDLPKIIELPIKKKVSGSYTNFAQSILKQICPLMLNNRFRE
jgi:hypothetical protein